MEERPRDVVEKEKERRVLRRKQREINHPKSHREEYNNFTQLTTRLELGQY